MHMATLTVVLGALAWQAKNKSLGTKMQHAVMSILTTLIAAGQVLLPTLAGMAVSNGCVFGDELQALLRDKGLLAEWIRAPSKFPPQPLEGNLPIAWVVWMIFRHRAHTELAEGLAKALTSLFLIKLQFPPLIAISINSPTAIT